MDEPIRVIEEFGDGSDCLLLNPSGTLVGVFTYDRNEYRGHTLAVHSTADGKLVGGPLRLGDCRALKFLDDATLLIANERKLLRWKVSGKPKAVAGAGAFLYDIAVCPARNLLAALIEELHHGMLEWRVVLASLKTGKRRWTAPIPLSLTPNSLMLSPNGRLLVVEIGPMRSEERGLLAIDVETGRRLQTFFADRAWGVTFAPDEGALFAVTEARRSTNALIVYELTCADPVREIALPSQIEGVAALSFAPDGSWLDVIAYTGHRARINPATGKVLSRHKPSGKMAYASRVVVSANGRAAAGVAEDYTVAVWALDD